MIQSIHRARIRLDWILATLDRRLFKHCENCPKGCISCGATPFEVPLATWGLSSEAYMPQAGRYMADGLPHYSVFTMQSQCTFFLGVLWAPSHPSFRAERLLLHECLMLDWIVVGLERNVARRLFTPSHLSRAKSFIYLRPWGCGLWLIWQVFTMIVERESPRRRSCYCCIIIKLMMIYIKIKATTISWTVRWPSVSLPILQTPLAHG